MSFALDGLLFAAGWAHVLMAPYTKVEESFNLHAVHDVLMYGVGPVTLYNYDHFTFPGAVPRTFIGSVLLAWLSNPVIRLANHLGFVFTKFDLQIIVRLVLASINAFGLCLLRRAVARRFGRPTSLFFAILTISEFHIPFWMGRTLPNMFALFPVNLAMYYVLDRAPNSQRPSVNNVNKAIGLLTFTAVVFRAEVALLLAPFTFHFLYQRYVSLYDVLKVGLITGLVSVGLTLVVDSYFWDYYPVWPEFAGIYFNVYLGKSDEWGINPWHTYFTQLLPKLLLTSLPLSVLGSLVDVRARKLLQLSVVFVGLMSYLGHKEWRFIVYIVPLFNVAAARGARWMVARPKGSFVGRIFFVCALAMISANFALTGMSSLSSMVNYPGGEALALFNQRYNNSTRDLHVHISNLAAQTGASLFLQVNSPPYPSPKLLSASSPRTWIYNKTEGMSISSLTSTPGLTHLIVESPITRRAERLWTTVESVKGFERWIADPYVLKGEWKPRHRKELMEIVQRVREVLRIETKEKLWILERRQN